MTEVNVAEVSEITGESESEVMQRGLKSYVSREIREAKVGIKELKQE